jgi:hypothetical protein
MSTVEAKKRYLATCSLALSLFWAGARALAQSPESPPPAAGAPLPPAGVIPAEISLVLTGSPADGTFVYQQLQGAMDRVIKPTLRPGAAIHYGAIFPSPLPALVPGGGASFDVSVTIEGGDDSSTVTGTTIARISDAVMPPAAPSFLFLSDDPEYVQTEGLIFRGNVDTGRAARLYYYHANVGLPRDFDLLLTADAGALVHVVASGAGPASDVMTVGHAVSRDFLWFKQQNEGIVVDVRDAPFVLRHELVLQGELVAGALEVEVVRGGPVQTSLVATPAGAPPDPYLAGPRLPYDGHNRHGAFSLDGYGTSSATYSAGGPDAAVLYGMSSSDLHNVDSHDTGRDLGDYGVIHQITFQLVNPTDETQDVYFYEKPLGGPATGSFLIDGRLKELGCARLPQPYWITTYRLAPHMTGASTTLTMMDGGSYAPLEFGVSATRPLAYTPPVNAPDGCAPFPFGTQSAAPAALMKASPAAASAPTARPE